MGSDQFFFDNSRQSGLGRAPYGPDHGMQRITHAIIVIVLFLSKQSATISSYMKICI